MFPTPSGHPIIPLTQEVETKNSHTPARQKTPPGKTIEKSDKVIPISIETKTTRNNFHDSPGAVAREKGIQTGTETHHTGEIDRKTPVPSEPAKNHSDIPELLLDDLSVDLPEKTEITEKTPCHLNRNYTLSKKSGIAKDMYLEYFQLIQKPFQINTDPFFLWLGEKQKEALATLTYGLQENKSFLLFTGDVGVGKTTIVKAMLQELGQNNLAAIINNPIMESLDFFNYVAKSFGLSGKYISKGDFLEAFGDFLLASHYKGKRVLLIIDECQLLDSSLLNEIRLFLNFEKKGTLLINVFFVGQLEFKKMLLQPENRAIRQRIAVSYNIPPLSLKETEKYIEYRLAVAGNSKKIFKAAAIREIYNFSKGYPRLINIIADRALLTGYINSARQIKKGIIKECAEELDFSAINKNQEFKA